MYKVITFVMLIVVISLQCSPSEEIIALEKTQKWLSEVTEEKYTLNQLKKLKDLRITDDDVETIELITNLKSLENLDLSNTQVTDLTPLKESGNLKILNLSYTPVRDLSRAAGPGRVFKRVGIPSWKVSQPPGSESLEGRG